MYKYFKKEYSELLLIYGYLRVGTLYDFRKIEHKKGIADPKEGKKTVVHHIKNLNVNSKNWKTKSNTLNYRSLKQFDMITDKGANLQFHNTTIINHFNTPDRFIFCTSKKIIDDVGKELEEYNCCLEITDPFNFFKCISVELNKIKPIRFNGWHEVTYKDRNEKWNGENFGIAPELIKENFYKGQSEIRGIWEVPDGLEINPEFIISKDIRNYVKEVKY
jgi:hypothetical protein